MVDIIAECSHTSISDEPSRDTVSSVGVNRTKNLPSTETCDHICYFRQALALDEFRVKFLPEYVYGSMSHQPKSQFVPPHADDHFNDHVKEVWFAGRHSDMYVPLALE